MKAVTWQGKESVSVEVVPDPVIQEPTDAIIRVTSTAVCGSDLHLYAVLMPYMKPGDILGHESMGIVEEVGSAVTNLKKGDRVVIPFQISCGSCYMCRQGLQTQCEVTQVREKGMGAQLFGFSELYGSVPGGQAEYLRVPHADYGPIKVGSELPDHRYLFLSDILPTAWQGVQYANVPDGGTLAVYGLGPVGQFAARIGTHLGYRVIGVDPVEERRKLAGQYGVEVLDLHKDIADELREMTDGRGPDSVVDAVGMEAHGSPVGKAAQTAVGLLPDKLAQKAMETAGTDRLSALHGALDAVRRGGTVSLSGVYGGTASPMPLMNMFDKQLNLRMGQCNVKRWVDDLMPLVEDSADPLGVTNLVTHQASLEDAPELYEKFQKKEDGCIKVVFQPGIQN
ncbi:MULTISPECIES: zinc-dependent alcohol dehydrogenase [unclassified Arthrobacter]|uniref:zinc-dependent alcohol dehydrogenase n=1 Tax=unclassified Arthrobacter TaxID=235627 RepID=UPI002107259E|nr:glutathione-dependent formaldehyde dehydrogenase [Arthrobacter sp. zg-Y1116]MCQ1986391.1 glutathione-dependent formaldehyde dehydrogenase [Arthrobacter sp. zg-Y844]